MTSLKYEFPSLSLRQISGILGVSRSWYYERAVSSDTRQPDLALRDAIERIVLDFPGYGYRRVTAELVRQGWKVNHKRVLRMMHQEGLLCELRRSWTPTP